MSSTPASSRLFALLTFVVVALYLFLAYRNIVIFDYPAAPGGDLVNHYITYQNLISQGVSVINIGYPQLFHLVILLLTTLTGQGFYTVVLWISPIIPVLAALATGHVARKNSGPIAGFITTSVFLFATTQPHQTLLDGGYPSFIASAILLPLVLYYLSQSLDQGGRRNWILTCVFALLLFTSHHLTGVYLTIIGGILIILRIPWNRWQSWMMVTAIVGGVLLIAERPLRLITEVSIKWSGTYPWIQLKGVLDNPNAIWQFADYPVGIGYLPFVVGVFSLFVVTGKILRKHANSQEIALVIWALLLLISSQIPELVFPVRLARDSAVPLVILTGIFLGQLLESRKQLWHTAVITAAVILIALPHFQETIRRLTTYNEHITYSNAIENAIKSTNPKYLVTLDNLSVQSFHPESALAIFPEDTSESNRSATLSYISQFESVLVVTKGTTIPWQSQYIESLGFTSVSQYNDPIQSAWLFRKK